MGPSVFSLVVTVTAVKPFRQPILHNIRFLEPRPEHLVIPTFSCNTHGFSLMRGDDITRVWYRGLLGCEP